MGSGLIHLAMPPWVNELEDRQLVGSEKTVSKPKSVRCTSQAWLIRMLALMTSNGNFQGLWKKCVVTACSVQQFETFLLSMGQEVRSSQHLVNRRYQHQRWLTRILIMSGHKYTWSITSIKVWVSSPLRPQTTSSPSMLECSRSRKKDVLRRD